MATTLSDRGHPRHAGNWCRSAKAVLGRFTGVASLGVLSADCDSNTCRWVVAPAHSQQTHSGLISVVYEPATSPIALRRLMPLEVIAGPPRNSRRPTIAISIQ